MSRPNKAVFIALAATAWTAIPGSAVRAQNTASNPYSTVEGVWAPLPDGRTWGSTSAVAVAPDGETIWAIDRCGANNCEASHDQDIVFQFDKSGWILTSFGAGLIQWPHGLDVDRQGNVWVADARGGEGRGHQVLKFSPRGDVLMRLGTAGVAGRTRTTLDQPNDVLVAPNGNIFVADGHPAGGNNRIVKYAPDGTYLMEWGETGSAPGEFRTPHALAMDSQGLLYVGDRSNRRIQVFDQDGEFIRDYYHLGRASGLAIDSNDWLYIADSESNMGRNAGFKRGVRVMDIQTATVLFFIPDPEPDQDNSGTSAAEGVAVDNEGNVYGAEVGPRALRKHVAPASFGR
jgi:sugar lactone lactonase YvrE